MLFEVEVMETLGESKNTPESITTKEKHVKHIEKYARHRKVYFKAVRTFKRHTVYYCERWLGLIVSSD